MTASGRKVWNRRDFWVFGYASLMWRPGFAFETCRPARLYGYHRSLCVSSIHWRGTSRRPGLVFGLRAGGACRGCAFRVHPRRIDEVCAYLRAREQVTAVYLEKYLPVRLLDTAGRPARRAQALCFVVDVAHPQYAGEMDDATRCGILRRASGVSGDNLSYVRNTLDHLRAMNVRDRNLTRLWRCLEAPQSRPRRSR